jgi:hypothetical protein
MSWDLFIQDLPRNIKSVKEIPNDFKPKELGSKKSLIEKVKIEIPNIKFIDSSWYLVEGTNYSIEINFGSDELVNSIAFHIRGSNLEVINVVDRLLKQLKVRAIDSSTGELFNSTKSIVSFQKWISHKDNILNN